MSKNLNKVSFSEIVVESRLGFKPNPDIFNGLCLGHISNITLEEVEISATLENGTPSSWDMAGKKSVNLNVEFKQLVTPKDNNPRFITLKESIISTKKSNGEPIEPKVWNNLVTEQFRRLQHIVNVFDKEGISPISKAIPEELYPDYNDSVEVRIAKATKLFKHFLKAIQGDEKAPRYADKLLWIKVVAKVPEGTYYVIPAFVGKGYLEIFKNNVAPALELSPSESVVLTKKETKKDSKPDMNHKDEDAQPKSEKPSPSKDDLLAELGV